MFRGPTLNGVGVRKLAWPSLSVLESQLGLDMDSSTNGAGRSIDIELGGQEVITIDLGDLDPSPEDVLDLLKEGQCKVSVWTRLASEYWRKGYLAAAETIAHAAIECMCCGHLSA